MAKTKTPFFSLGSRGTVGGVLTSQKRGKATILRETPVPTDPYSLNQAYQRWDYRDYAYLWTLLSNSEKQIYRTKGSRYHITGFSQWMKESLKHLPDLCARWHLDEKAGDIAYDSSKNENNGIIYNALPTTGIIEGACSFDGSLDWINFGSDPTLHNFTAKSVSFFFKAPAFTGAERYIFDHGYWVAPYGDRIMLTPNSNILSIYLRNTAGVYVGSSFAFTPDTWHHAGYSWDGTTIRYYLDGVEAAPSLAFSGTMACSGAYHTLGRRSIGLWYLGLLDEFRIDRRALDQTEMKRHSARRYPA